MTLEFEVETAASKPKFSRCARDITVVLAQSFGDQTALNFSQRIRERDVLQRNSHRGPRRTAADRRNAAGWSNRRPHVTQLRRKLLRRDNRAILGACNHALNLIT